MKGRLRLLLFDRAGNPAGQFASDNDIVLTGRDLVAKQFTGQKIDPISHLAVGISNDANEPTAKTSLDKEIFRKPINEVDPEADIVEANGRMRVTITTDLDFLEGNGALTEAGLFNAEADGVMYNRVVFPAVNKTEDFKLTLVWEILF